MRSPETDILTEITSKLDQLNTEEFAVILSKINALKASKSNDDRKISSIDEERAVNHDDEIIDPEDLDISYDEEDEVEYSGEKDSNDDVLYHDQQHFDEQALKRTGLIEEEARKSEDSAKSSSGSSTDLPLPNLFEEGKVQKSYKSRQSIGSGLTNLPDDRGRTRIGPQAEHAIAYVVFETILKRAIAGQKMSKASRIVHDTFSSFLIDSASMEKIEEIFKLYSNEADRFRKTKNYFKNNAGNIPDEHVNTTKEALKIAARLKYAKMIEASLDTCIFGSNKMANLSYPDDGVPPNPNTGKERAAKDDLMILNEFLERLYKNLEQEKTGNEDILNQRYFLNKLKDKWDISEDTVSAIMKSAREEMQNRQRLGKSPNIKSILRQELAKNLNIDAISNEIIDRMSKLFYYPSIDGVKAYEIDGVTENWAVSQKTWASKSQKYNKGTLPRSNNLEEMYKTVALAQ